MRCFIAIKFPIDFENEIKKIQDKLPDFIRKKAIPENLHLTLKFLGEIDEDKIKFVDEELSKANFQSFFSNSEEIGFFDNKSLGIVWISLTNCENLQKEIDESLKEIFPKEKRFMAHLTIARMAHVTKNRIKSFSSKEEFLNELKNIKVPLMKFSVKNFYLMESVLKQEGPEYKIVKKYELN